jgi:hypothetical protein
MEVSGQLHASAALPPTEANFKGVNQGRQHKPEDKKSLRWKRCSLTWDGYSSGESATASKNDTDTAEVRKLLLWEN